MPLLAPVITITCCSSGFSLYFIACRTISAADIAVITVTADHSGLLCGVQEASQIARAHGRRYRPNVKLPMLNQQTGEKRSHDLRPPIAAIASNRVRCPAPTSRCSV